MQGFFLKSLETFIMIRDDNSVSVHLVEIVKYQSLSKKINLHERFYTVTKP